MNTDVLILGAGPAGLGVGSALQRAQFKDFLIIEKAALAGGLSGSFELAGTTFDFGGHSFTSSLTHVQEWIFSLLEMHQQRRRAFCFHDGQIIDYPFQNSYQQLNNQKIIADCDAGYKNKEDNHSPTTFEEQALSTFGSGVFSHFISPYNRKLWGLELSDLESNWAATRVAGIASNNKELTRIPLTSSSMVAYPKSGGFQEITKAFEKSLQDKIRYESEIVGIDIRKKIVKLSSGTAIKYEKLVSTIPLHELARLIIHSPRLEIDSSLEMLRVLPLRLVALVFRGRINSDMQRIYTAEERHPFHKIVLNNNSSPSLRAQVHHGVMFECSVTPGKCVTDEHLLAHSLTCCEDLKLASRGDLDAWRVLDIPYAYPVPTLGYKDSVEAIKKTIGEFDIRLCGRFAEWKYVNIDQVLADSLTLVEELVSS